MKTKRMILDAALVLLLPLQMAYSLVGEAYHEVAGTLMLVLFILHHVLNRSFFTALFRGPYPPRRIFQTAVNLLLLLFMILQPLCGILMSKHLFAFLPTGGLSSLARQIHLPLANWGFVLMSLHAGTHLGSMLGKARGKKLSLLLLSLISLYGIFAFFRRQIPQYLFLRLSFVFLDYSEPLIFFLLDYLAVMVLFGMIGYGVICLLSRKKG